jgi:hypothetical protein
MKSLLQAVLVHSSYICIYTSSMGHKPAALKNVPGWHWEQDEAAKQRENNLYYTLF